MQHKLCYTGTFSALIHFCLLNLAKMNRSGSYKEIQDVVWPKEYNGSKTNPNDIALIKMKTPFEWSRLAKPACLPTSDFVPEYAAPLAVSLTLSGFSLKMIAVRYGLAFRECAMGMIYNVNFTSFSHWSDYNLTSEM